jgi:hypothetical protein
MGRMGEGERSMYDKIRKTHLRQIHHEPLLSIKLLLD